MRGRFLERRHHQGARGCWRPHLDIETEEHGGSCPRRGCTSPAGYPMRPRIGPTSALLSGRHPHIQPLSPAAAQEAA
eukprot:5847137-Pyramimonas_sp.AAC.1